MQKFYKISAIVFFIVLILAGCNSRNNASEPNGPLLTVAPSDNNIQVLTPSNDQTVKPRSELLIKWTYTGNMTKVDLLLYRKREVMQPIAYSLDNNGSYLWKVPADLPSSHHYRIEVRNNTNTLDAEFSNYFFIPPFQ